MFNNILSTLKLYKNQVLRTAFFVWNILGLCFGFSEQVCAEDAPSMEWTKIFSGSSNDYYRDVIETKDNGLVVAGYSSSPDAGFSTKGSADAILVKYDSDGNQLWLRNFGGSKTDYFVSVVETSEKDLIAVGYSNSEDADFEHKGSVVAIIAKYTKDGDYCWSNSFAGTGTSQFISVIETKDNRIFAVGYSEATDAGFENKGTIDSIIVEYDRDGNQVGLKSIGGTSGDYIRGATKTDDGGFVVIGYSSSADLGFENKGSSDAIIVKYNANAEQVWIKNFGGSSSDYFYGVVAVSDGLVAVGYSNSTNAGFSRIGGYDAIIVKYDNDGNEQWIKNYGGSGNDYFVSAIETVSKGVVAVGYTASTDAGFENKGENDAVIVKYDSKGNELWCKSLGGSGSDSFRGLTETRDGKNLIVVGYTNSTDAGFENKGGYEGIIIKYEGTFEIERESMSNIIKMYAIPTNTIKLSVDVNEIVFDNFSYTESVEKLDALKLTVSSSLPYNLVTSIESDIIGTTFGQKIDKSMINIKSSNNGEYQSFSNTNSSLLLLENQEIGKDAVHSIDIKLSGNMMNKVDVYKTVLKLEVVQR